MREEFNQMKVSFSTSVRALGSGRITYEHANSAVKEQARELAQALHDHPELGACIVADIGQIKGLLENKGIAATLQDRLQAQTLTKAFLQGVPEDRKSTIENKATIRKLQAIADFLRIAIPLVGATKGASQPSGIEFLTDKIPVPFIGKGLSMLTGAIYGAASAEVVRSAVNRMDDDTRKQAFAIAHAISVGSPSAFVEAHAKIDVATATGEISKSLTDKGNFTKNFIFRTSRFAKHFVTEKFGAMKTLFSSSDSIGEKALAVFGIVAPVAAVAIVGLGIAGVIASGPFMPVVLFLVGSFYVISSYAKGKESVISFLNDNKKADAKNLEERFKKSKTEYAKQVKEKYKKEATDAVKKAHKNGLYDIKLREYVKTNNTKEAIDTYCDANKEEFSKFSEEREASAEKHFETITEDDIKSEFHQKFLIQSKTDQFIKNETDRLITRLTQAAVGVDFSKEVEKPPQAIKNPDGVTHEKFKAIQENLKKQEAPLDSFRFSIDLSEAPAP